MGEPLRRQRAVVYCRISDDREGQGLGVERQRADCLARAEREGWHVAEVYTDNDVGASTKSRKARPSYKRMLDAAERGDVDIIISYSNSRLTRRPFEWETLISLYERKGVLLRTIVSGDTNLETADGRAVARTVAAWDAAEAERTGERVARAAKQRREEGKFHGGNTPYGYAQLGDGRLGINPEHAKVINEAARRVASGESLYGVCQDFNRRGTKTGPSPRARHGAAWHRRTLKNVLTSPATIGCMEDEDGTLRQVAEPILDRPAWETLREILYAPSRYAGTHQPDWSNRRKYALSGLLCCGLCGHRLSGSRRPASPRRDGVKRPNVQTFACIPAVGGCGKLRADYPPIEEWVMRQVFARLEVPGVQTALSTREEPTDDDALRQQIADAERGLEQLDDDYADGVLDRTRYRRQVARLTERVDTMRSQLAEALRETFIIDTNGRSIQDAWAEHAEDTPWRRALLAHVIDRVTIMPQPTGVASTLTRRRGESDEQLESRRKNHQELLLRQRVRVSWLT